MVQCNEFFVMNVKCVMIDTFGILLAVCNQSFCNASGQTSFFSLVVLTKKQQVFVLLVNCSVQRETVTLSHKRNGQTGSCQNTVMVGSD